MSEPTATEAAVLAAGVSSDDPTGMTSCLLMWLDKDAYAMPLDAVVEIHQLAAVRPAPEGRGGLVGYLDLRGAVVPTVDLRTALGAPGRAWDPSMHMVVARTGMGRLALVVDRVEGIVDCEPDPAGASASGRTIAAIAKVPEVGLVPVLDPGVLLDGAGVDADTTPATEGTESR